jgi:uncharacterized repeat protein (TIGR04138 family)
MQEVDFEEVLEQIVRKDTRYQKDAYRFVREALDHTQKVVTKNGREPVRHVTGQELLEGIRTFALQHFGPMALTLLQEWGVRSGEDFGEIVFSMVEMNLLAKTQSDSRDDFKGGYDFVEAFRKPFLPSANTVTPRVESKPTPQL